MFIVELEASVWLAPWDGDPGRTLARESAKTFRTEAAAHKAIEEARKYRRFKKVIVEQV